MQPDPNQSSPGPRGSSPRRALIAALAFGLSLAGCFSHDFVSGARVRIENLRVVSEKRVGRTLFEYQIAADCRNDAPPVHGVTALAISGSPEIAIVQGVLHCGPLVVGETQPSLDSITIRQDRTQPFDPASIEWVAASYGAYHKESEARFDRTSFDYVYRLDITNLGSVPRHVVATARSTAPELQLLDAVVEIDAPPNSSVTPLDSFSFRLDRTHPFDPKTIEWDLRLGAGDTSPPVLELFVPSQVQTGAALRATARASDDVGVSNVQFFVDGLLVGTDPSAPYELAYNAPDEPGRVLIVRAVATDTTGNASEKQASVAVTAVPDQTPPVIDALHLPPSAAPGATLTVRANVSDDRGVAMVRLSLDGAPQGSVGTPPYELSFRVPAGAQPGQSLTIDVEAEDTSGNRAQVQGTIAVVAAPDQTPPSGVSVLAPQQVTPGQTIRLDATAVDDVGILAVAFFADGALLASDGETPYEAHFSVSSDKPVGTQISFHVEATDFSGNHTASAPITLAIVEAGLGSIGGEVYDDTTGLPLAAARVAVLESRGAPPASPQLTTTDARGRYHLRLAEGKAVLAISHDGMTSALREVAVESGRVVTSLDARLTPIGVTRSILAAAGGMVVVAGESLAVPPGAFAADTEVSLTALGAQGLPAPLPLGWSPLAAFEVGPGAAVTQTPLELTFSGLDLGHAVAARFDLSTRRWLRSEIVVPDSGMPRMLLAGTGTVAIVQADTAPTVPPEAALGEALEGVAAVAIPSGATAELLPSPHVIFMDPSARSAVSARLRDAATLPSGTPFEVDFAESYARTDGSETRPAPFTQDVLLYRGAQGPAAAFAASPSRVFDPATLREGSINLAAHRLAETEGSAEIGPAGGPVASPSGVSLLVPPAALLEPTPVSVRSVSLADSGLAGDARFVVLAVIDVDLDDSALASAATLGISLAAPLPADAQVLALRAVEVLGATRQELIGVATANGAMLTLVAGAAGLPLPGVIEGGRNTLIRMKDPVGFATGSIRTNGAPAASALATSDAFPFVSLTDIASPGYVLAAPLGASSLEGTGLEDGSRGSAALALATRGEVTTRNLELGASRPTVIEVTPADGVTGVGAYASVTLRFSRAMDAATIDASTLRLQGPTGLIAASVSLLSDGVTAALRPAAALANDALFSILVSTAAHDRFGNALFGNQPDESFASGFRTSDSTPPPRPEAGQVEVTPPAAGRTTIHGSQGAVEPGAVVAVRNLGTGLITTVLAGPDGSFSLSVAASLTDGLELTLTDAAGNATSLDLGRAPPPLGTGLVGPEGGVVAGAGGVAALIPAGTLPRDTEVTVTKLDPATLPSPFRPDLEGIVGGAVSFSMGGFEIADVAELRFEMGQRLTTRITDQVPPFAIDENVTIPADAAPGTTLSLVLTGRDKAGHSAELRVDLAIVTDAPDATPHTSASETMPVLTLTAPAQATPGQSLHVVARAAPPDIKVRVPADPSLAGDEQIVVFEVSEWQGRPFFNLLDTASVKTLASGERVIESNSPPFRGLRKDIRQLMFAVMKQQMFSFAQLLLTKPSEVAKTVRGITIDAMKSADEDAAFLATLLNVFGDPPPDIEPYEFVVIPMRGGVPATIHLFDFDTNNELAKLPVAPVPPGEFSAVLVLGEDGNDPSVTATTSPANDRVPVNAGISLAFSHLIDTATLTSNSLYIEDSQRRRIDATIALPQGGNVFSVLVKPLHSLRTGEKYKLVATTAIKRVGGAALAAQFEMHFTAGLAPEVIGSFSLPNAGSFDVAHDVAVVTDRTGMTTVDLHDPTQLTALGRVNLDPNAAGIVRFVRTMTDTSFPNWRGDTVTGDLAILDAGSSETFSALRFYSLADPALPLHLGGTLVGSPVSSILATQEIPPIPDPEDPMKFSVFDATSHLLDGVPKTPAQPWVIDTDGAQTAYFINQGIGLMTVNLGLAIPPPELARRGSQLGPSYAPIDKTGSIVVTTDPALDADDGTLAITQPVDLTLVTQATVNVVGTVSDDHVTSVLVNGFKKSLDPANPPGAQRSWSLDLPLHEGVNRVLASAYDSSGTQLGQAGIQVLRSFATNPLAGPGTITISLPPLGGTSAASQTVTASVTDKRRFDRIYINGQFASMKSCPVGTLRAGNECGWSGAGSVAVPLVAGANAIVATAIDLDAEDVDGPGSFFDLDVEEGLALAVKKDLFLFDASSVALVGKLPMPSNDAFRVTIAPRVQTDLDNDGLSPLAENDDGDAITSFDERKNLALVGSGSGPRLTFVDITEPQNASVLGWLETGAGAYRAAARPAQGIAWLTTGSGIQQIDLTHPNHEGLWDQDANGTDDRILSDTPVSGAQDIRVDDAKGIGYVLQKGQGIAAVRLDSCDTDVGVDATRLQTPRTTRYSTLASERQDILSGIRSGLSKPECSAVVAGGFALLAQGSSACIWRSDGRCSTAYQPGISDYDYELFTDAAGAETCAKKMEEEIVKSSHITKEDLSVFAESRSQFEAGYRAVEARASGSCGAGGDPYGDLCLGRTGLMLKWVLEGEWVRSGGNVYDGGIDLERALATLRAPLPSSYLNDPRHVEPSHVPLLEGKEWICLEDFMLAKSLASIRVRGAGLGDVPIVDPDYLRKIHHAAKAGIRSIYGKLLASEVGNRLLLGETRDDYNGPSGCRTGSRGSSGRRSSKPCDSFEEYVAGKAIESVENGLGILSQSEADLAYEFYRRKADVGLQIAGEQEANQFIASVMRTIDAAKNDASINGPYGASIAAFNDGQRRQSNLNSCGTAIPHYQPGGDSFKIKVPLRLFNAGYGGVASSDVVFYHDGNEVKRVEAEIPPPGGSRFYSNKEFDADAQSGGLHSVQFRVDPNDQISEYDKRNDADGFFYYVIDANNTTPPTTQKFRPAPPASAPVPTPPASPVCLDTNGAAPPSPGVELIALLDGQSNRSVAPGTSVERSFIVRNIGSVSVDGLEIHDSELGNIQVGTLAAGASTTITRQMTASSESIFIATLTGTDPDGNGIGVASTFAKLGVAEPRSGIAIHILSPPRSRNPHDPDETEPFETVSANIPVSGVVESTAAIASVEVNGVMATVTGTAPRWEFRTSHPVPLTVGLNELVATARSAGDEEATDPVTVRRLAAECIAVEKRVDGEERKRVRPGETVNYSIHVEAGPRDLTAVSLLETSQETGFAPAPFDLAAGASRDFSFSYTVPSGFDGGSIENEVVATAADASGDTCGPIADSAELWIDELVLKPKLMILGVATAANPKTRQLEVIYTPLDRNVSGRATGTRFEWIDNGLPATTAIDVYEYIREKVKDTNLPAVPTRAQLEVDAQGRLIAKSNGWNIVRAVHQSDLTGGTEIRSNYAIVLVGAELESIQITPRSLLSTVTGAVGDAIEAIKKNLDKKAKASPDVDKKGNPPLLLANGPIVCGATGLANASHVVARTGYLELTGVKFKLFGGVIEGVDLLAAVRSGIAGLATTYGGPLGAPIGWALGKALNVGVTHAVDFTVKNPAVLRVRSGFGNGLATANAAGMTLVTGTLDLGDLGKKKDDVLSFVIPELLSTELRTDPTYLRGPECVDSLHVFSKMGSSNLSVSFDFPARLVDYGIDAVGGGGTAKYLRKLVPDGVPIPSTGRGNVVILPDDGMSPVSLEMEAELTLNELKIYGFVIGFKTPTLFTRYAPNAFPGLPTGPPLDPRVATYLPERAFDQPVKGIGPYRTRASVQTCIPFVGQKTDIYDPAANAGGASILVGRSACTDPPQAMDDLATTCADTAARIDVLANDTANVPTVAIDGAAANGQLFVNPDQTVDYVANAGFVGADSFTYRVTDAYGATVTARVDVTVVDCGQNTIVTGGRPGAVDDDAEVNDGESVNVDVTNNDIDPNGTGLQVTIESSPLQGTAIVELDGSITYQAAQHGSGIETVGYRITDGAGHTASASLRVDVNACPTADAGDVEFLLAPAVQPISTLDGSASSDPEAAPLLYFWTQTSGPPVVLTGADATPSFAVPLVVNEPIAFELVVSDGRCESDPAAVSRMPLRLAGVVINEVVPGATSQVELRNVGQTVWDLRGWTLGGYVLGSNPARERYVSTTTGGTAAVDAFHPDAYAVLEFPGRNLSTTFLVLESNLLPGQPVDSAEVGASCVPNAGLGRPSLARIAVPTSQDVCGDFEWRSTASMGRPN